jgi:uncharacterized membrane protein YbhN (UPF0104 family)
MKNIIEFFTKENDIVLDYFMGVGGTLLGASMSNRRAIGIDLNPEYIKAYKKASESMNYPSQQTICGNSLDVMKSNEFKKILNKEFVSLVLIDPPYGNMMSKEKTGDDIIVASQEFKQKNVKFWIRAILSTFLSWSSRYLVANALIVAFFAVSDHFVLFARQLVIWIMMLVMPTPGGSGFAEYIFTYFCGDMIITDPGMKMAAATLISLLWRLVTYYPYLLIGAIIFPRWVVKLIARKN